MDDFDRTCAGLPTLFFAAVGVLVAIILVAAGVIAGLRRMRR